MIDVIHKIHTSKNNPNSLFVEVTVDSITNQALHIGYETPSQKVVVYRDEIDKPIEALQTLKVYL